MSKTQLSNRGSVFDQVQKIATERPDRTAVIEPKTGGVAVRTTWSELASRARVYAASFAAIAPAGQVIPLYQSKSAENVAAMLGALGAGCAFSCLNRKLRPPQVEQILQSAGAAIALIDGPGFLSWRTKFETGWTASTRWLLLPDEKFDKIVGKIVSKLPEGTPVERWQPDAPDGPSAAPRAAFTGPGTCLFTSGSTGTPKGVLISSRDLAERSWAEVEWFDLTPNDVLLNVLPFSFDVGLNQLLSALSVGCSIVLLDSWLPADILSAAATHRATGISSVPAIWQDMLNAHLPFDTTGAHSSLRYLTVSGGDLPLPLLNRLPTLAPGVGIFKTYGQTETFRSTSLRPDEFDDHRQSVGRAFASASVVVVRDDGSPCEPGEVGEVVHSGLGTMLGYLDGNDPQKKLRTGPWFNAGDEGGESSNEAVVFTGDHGYLDEDGYLYLMGRRDSMLKIAGNRVYPQEVVSQILDLADIDEAHVTGIAIAEGPKRLVAFVVARTGADITSASIRAELAQLLPSYMVPETVFPLAAFPRTASGKYDAPALQTLAETYLKGESLDQ